jgi:cytochrome o ubiquinol oxidase subunit III
MTKEINNHSDKVSFGFWIYLMTDLIMFSVLFATYAVLKDSVYGGPTTQELFDLNFVMIETMILLTSSFTCGLGMIALYKQQTRQMLAWFITTFLLGLSFLAMELYEFSHLIQEGHDWTKSAFLSSYFTLVGTHGLHITLGLLWLGILLVYVFKKGLNQNVSQKFVLLSLFWHFLDIVWIFIFTIVYLMGIL